jgi:hypothetical protein
LKLRLSAIVIIDQKSGVFTQPDQYSVELNLTFLGHFMKRKIFEILEMSWKYFATKQ